MRKSMHVHDAFGGTEKMDEQVNEVDAEFPKQIPAAPFIPQPRSVSEHKRSVMRDIYARDRTDVPRSRGIGNLHHQIAVTIVEHGTRIYTTPASGIHDHAQLGSIHHRRLFNQNVTSGVNRFKRLFAVQETRRTN